MATPASNLESCTKSLSKILLNIQKSLKFTESLSQKMKQANDQLKSSSKSLEKIKTESSPSKVKGKSESQNVGEDFFDEASALKEAFFEGKKIQTEMNSMYKDAGKSVFEEATRAIEKFTSYKPVAGENEEDLLAGISEISQEISSRINEYTASIKDAYEQIEKNIDIGKLSNVAKDIVDTNQDIFDEVAALNEASNEGENFRAFLDQQSESRKELEAIQEAISKFPLELQRQFDGLGESDADLIAGIESISDEIYESMSKIVAEIQDKFEMASRSSDIEKMAKQLNSPSAQPKKEQTTKDIVDEFVDSILNDQFPQSVKDFDEAVDKMMDASVGIQPGFEPSDKKSTMNDEGYVEDAYMVSPLAILGLEDLANAAMSASSILSNAALSAGKALISMGAKAIVDAPSMFGDLIRMVGKFVAALDPGLMAQLQLVMSDLMATIGIGLRPIIQAAIPIFRQLANVLRPVMEALAPIMQQFASALIDMAVPYILIMADAILKMLPVIESIIPIFTELADLMVEMMPVMSFAFDMLARTILLAVGVFFSLLSGIKTVIAGMIDAAAWLVSFVSKSKSESMKSAANAMKRSADKSAESAYKAFEKAVTPRKEGKYGQQAPTEGMAAKAANYTGIADLGKGMMQAAFSTSAQDANINTANNTKRMADNMDKMLNKMNGPGRENNNMAGVRR